MSPLDEQLHAALSSRAAALAPPPDPMAGIERRAAGIRRRRLAASLTAGALVIAAAALTVPSLLPADPTRNLTPATQGPEPGWAKAVLDPTNPWPLRGAIPDNATEDVSKFWTKDHPGTSLTPLYGHINPVTNTRSVVFLSTGGDGPVVFLARTIATDDLNSAESTFERGLSTHSAIPATRSLNSFAFAFAAVDADNVARLFVVASNTSRRVEFASDGRSFRDISLRGEINRGVGITSLPITAASRLRVISEDGSAYEKSAPTVSNYLEPENLLSSWPTRGAMESDVLEEAKAAWAKALGTTVDRLGVKILFAGDTDSGVRYVMGQAWAVGAREAHQVSYSEGGSNGPQPFIGPATAPDPAVLAFLIGSLPGTSVDQLVVIPRPRTGQVLYDDDATGAFRPVTGQDHLEGVVLIDRSKTATSDRLQLFDGNGDLDNPTYEGPVAPLLCGLRECG